MIQQLKLSTTKGNFKKKRNSIHTFMGKFKEFLINEEVGLADIGPRIDKVFDSQWFSNQIGGAVTSSDFTGSEQDETMGTEGHRVYGLSTDMTMPSVSKQGRITSLLMNKNPIYMCLSDGTEAHFTYDEYKRIEGEPSLGKTMTIIFQRHPQDQGEMYSKIDKAIVID